MRMLRFAWAALVPALAGAQIPATIAQAVAADGGSGGARSDRLPDVPKDTESYDIGLLVGSQMANNGLASAISRQALARGINDALAGKIVTSEERDRAQDFMRSGRTALAQKNAARARDFLADNAHRPDIRTLESGLQYRVIDAGDEKAASPGAADQVSLRYRAELANGTVLDRSEDHAQPPIFRVSAVIPAWREALLTMHPGARWQLFVPPELGYGMNAPPPLPPGALIVYELDLLGVDSKPRMMPSVPTAPPAR